MFLLKNSFDSSTEINSSFTVSITMSTSMFLSSKSSFFIDSDPGHCNPGPEMAVVGAQLFSEAVASSCCGVFIRIDEYYL